LQFPSFAIGVDDLAEQDCAPIAQLPGPVAELVATAALQAYRQIETQIDLDDLKEIAFF